MMAIFWAFCCLASAAVNDFLFKLYTRKRRPYGLYTALIGVIWLVILTAIGDFTLGEQPGTTLFWGLLSGFCSITGNLLLIRAMRYQSAGVCSTIYRLNLVVVVLFACLLFHEQLTWSRSAGVLIAAGAIAAFYPRATPDRSCRRRTTERIGVLLALVAAVLRAGMGLSYKCGLLLNADSRGIVLVNAFWWIAGGIIYTLLTEKRGGAFSPAVAGYGTLSGFLVCAIAWTMAESLKTGEAAVVLPIAQMSFIGTFLLDVLFLGERLTIAKTAGALGGVAGILLLAG